MIASVIKNKHTYTFCQTMKMFLKKQLLMFLGNTMLLLRIVSECNAIRCVQGYLLIRSDHQNIRYAKILGPLLETVSALEIPQLFVHSDYLVFWKLCQVI